MGIHRRSGTVVRAASDATNKCEEEAFRRPSQGAALRLHTVLALEKFGLDPNRDNIEIAEVGYQLRLWPHSCTDRSMEAALPQAQCK